MINILNVLERIQKEEEVSLKKNHINHILKEIEEKESIEYAYMDEIQTIKKEVLTEYLNNMLSQASKERVDFYGERLIKALTEIKTTKYNDINLNRWKEYEDLYTDSLWIMKQRDNSGSHSGDYWGNFIPQIPNQLLRRYTKEGEWVLDPFLGSGTTLIEASRLGRNGIGIELQDKVAKMAAERMDSENQKNTQKIVVGNSQSIDLDETLKEVGIDKVQFVLMHPPYWDIIKFSENENDLSNTNSLQEFLHSFGKVVENALKYLEKGRFAAVVIGDKYEGGEWIPLGFYVMQEFQKRNCQLKSIIVKNFEETKGKRNQRNLWKYRALAGGFYIFKHEYIFLFKKLK